MSYTYSGTLTAAATGTENGVNATTTNIGNVAALSAASTGSSQAIVATSSYGADTIDAGNSVSNKSAIYAHGDGGGPGVYATSNTATAGWGAVVASNSSTGNGLYASSSSSSGIAVNATGFTAIHGVGSSSAASAGVSGTSSGQGGTGVYGSATYAGLCYGVYGTASNSSAYAGYFVGNVVVHQPSAGTAGNLTVEGNLTVNGTKTGFQIDHPLDPENMLLAHTPLESPELKNIYDGIAQADSNGEATIEMPGYFGALNCDFRYQLTAVGRPAPDLHVKEPLSCGKFVIGGAVPGQTICWQVTGIRKDPFARSQPFQAEREKDSDDRGFFVHPGAYGLAESRGLMSRRDRVGEQARDSTRPS